MEGYGILSLLPIITLFVLVIWTKRVLLAVTAATLVGSILLGGAHFAGKWLEMVQTAFMGGTVGYLFLLLALFGMLIILLDSSGAVTEFARWLSKYANSRKKALIITYILGWLIFVDDYLNNMAIATAMKRVTDSHKIPRTLLGYVINSTAAPVCILIPVSTWAVFYAGLFEQYGVTVNGSGMSAYIAAIPMMFYGWVSLVVLLLVVFGVIPLMGVTKSHNRIALDTGVVCTAECSMDNKEITAPDFSEITKSGDNVKANPWNFLIPLIVLVAVTIVNDINVMIGCMAAVVVTAVMMLLQKKMNLTALLDSGYSGVQSMFFVYVQITVAMTMVEINGALGLSDFVIATIGPLLNGMYLPAIVFAFCAVYSYFGGGFWDMAMIFMPIVIPLANNLGVNPILAGAALICATAAGSTTYVCGDAVIVCSRAIDIKPVYQMFATLPYAIISAIVSTILFLIAGIVM